MTESQPSAPRPRRRPSTARPITPAASPQEAPPPKIRRRSPRAARFDPAPTTPASPATADRTAPTSHPTPDTEHPIPLHVILYADGASRGNPGPASIGGVVLHPDGTELHDVSERIGRATNNVAEWRAAVAVLEAARMLGATSVELRMDSELVVRQITGRYQVKNAALIPFAERVKTLRRDFGRFAATHVPRALNHRADALANAALDRRD